MSAVTAMVVLESMKLRDNPQRTLMSALGPGFSTAFLMLNP
ncbi:MAG: hypothetical protein WDM89_19585 [Rhizomicrobium sp.]